MQATTEWPEKLNRRCWQRFVTENAVAYAACLGYDQGKEQVLTIVYPKNTDKSYFFCSLMKDRQHDVPEAVTRLVKEGNYA